MNITVIGASAGLGLRTVARAREAGHTVTTLSRTTDALPADPGVHVIAGDARDYDVVRRAISGADAILVTLGTGRSGKATTLFTDAARTLLRAAEQEGTTAPIIVVTGFGAGDSAQHLNPVVGTVMKLMLGKIYADKTQMEQLISASPMAWEIVRPARFTNGARTGTYKVLTDYTSGKLKKISRDDVANYLVTEAEKRINLRRYPALTS